VQHSDNATYTFALSHLPCSSGVLVMKQIAAVPNCMWLLSVTETQELTAVCYRDSRTDCCLLQILKNWLLSVTETQELTQFMKQTVAVPNNMWLLSVTETQELTAVCYRDSRTDSIHRFTPMREIKQKAIAGPTANTNWISKGFQPTVVQLQSSVCVCVCAEEEYCVRLA
jgi:hypothetical protein